MLQKTTAQRKLISLKKRIRIVQGGSSASKTFTIIPFLITYAIDVPNSEISIVSESIPHLKRGVIRDFIKIMKWTENWHEKRWNISDRIYKFSNGSFIEFFSADQPDKLRGSRRDVLFINECNNVTFESYKQLSIRTRKFIYLDYNPTNEFWVHTELKDNKNSDFLVLTYKDNETLEQSIIDEIEQAKEKSKTSAYWLNWWRVYGLGLIGSLDNVIFTNWKIIDKIPDEAKLLGMGLDFGFSNDPTAIIEVYNWNGKRILNEICFQTGLVNQEIAKKITKGVIVYADSSEPKSIEEIRRSGIMIKGVTKGADSVNFGIDVMQRQEYLVTSQSLNLIKELRNYSWDKDRDGKLLNKPVDNYNHCVDAVRYHEMETLLSTFSKIKAPKLRNINSW